MNELELKKLERDRLQYMVYIQSIEIKIMECEDQINRLKIDIKEKKLKLKEIEEKIPSN